jgi:hypothetical protein
MLKAPFVVDVNLEVNFPLAVVEPDAGVSVPPVAVRVITISEMGMSFFDAITVRLDESPKKIVSGSKVRSRLGMLVTVVNVSGAV